MLPAADRATSKTPTTMANRLRPASLLFRDDQLTFPFFQRAAPLCVCQLARLLAVALGPS